MKPTPTILILLSFSVIVGGNWHRVSRFLNERDPRADSSPQATGAEPGPKPLAGKVSSGPGASDVAAAQSNAQVSQQHKDWQAAQVKADPEGAIKALKSKKQGAQLRTALIDQGQALYDTYGFAALQSYLIKLDLRTDGLATQVLLQHVSRKVFDPAPEALVTVAQGFKGSVHGERVIEILGLQLGDTLSSDLRSFLDSQPKLRAEPLLLDAVLAGATRIHPLQALDLIHELGATRLVPTALARATQATSIEEIGGYLKDRNLLNQPNYLEAAVQQSTHKRPEETARYVVEQAGLDPEIRRRSIFAASTSWARHHPIGFGEWLGSLTPGYNRDWAIVGLAFASINSTYEYDNLSVWVDSISDPKAMEKARHYVETKLVGGSRASQQINKPAPSR